ncbi:MAG: hypothetical protein H6968_07500 [Chromatiaceae bacterium]|nr:hypothetical protein [Chromatiaceae bacterium]
MAFSNKKTVPELVKLEAPHQTNEPTETVWMKCSKASVHRKTHRIPEIRFEDQRLSSLPVWSCFKRCSIGSD